LDLINYFIILNSIQKVVSELEFQYWKNFLRSLALP